MFAKTVALAALAATASATIRGGSSSNKAPSVPAPKVNVYWGQTGSTRLRDYCQSSGFEYVTIGFVNNSPEQDASGLDYPGTNFGAHCAAEVYEKDGKKSKLLNGCTMIAADIPVCQALGKKVLLSIGGAWQDGTDYTVSTPAAGRYFANFLWGAFGPWSAAYQGPRPFDFGGKHVSVDGFDFDIEHKFGECTPFP